MISRSCDAISIRMWRGLLHWLSSKCMISLWKGK